MLKNKAHRKAPTYFDYTYFEGKLKKSSYINYNILSRRIFWRDKIRIIRDVNGKLLDIGCAYGFFLKHIRTKNIKKYGMDISKTAVKNAKTRCRNITIQSAEDISFKDNTFDCVTAFDVFEHTHNPKKFLSEVYRILRPEGMFVMQTPNPKILGPIIPDRDITHINKMEERRLIKLLIHTGFQIRNIYGNFYIFSTKRMRRIAPNILIVSRKP